MEITVYWTNFSKQELQKIFEYYREKAGYKIAKKLVDGIFSESLKLANHAEIGQAEELLKGRIQNFRYLIFKNYKIIYWFNIEKNWIEIVDVFDTRQNPPKISRSTSKTN